MGGFNADMSLSFQYDRIFSFWIARALFALLSIIMMIAFIIIYVQDRPQHKFRSYLFMPLLWTYICMGAYSLILYPISLDAIANGYLAWKWVNSPITQTVVTLIALGWCIATSWLLIRLIEARYPGRRALLVRCMVAGLIVVVLITILLHAAHYTGGAQ